ncbi:class I SAM-dependent methyltransferase [Endozoicomonas sp. SESOKO2]|uniref:class I SAM-dependent methyltransferase n=1 Tax=Endozoicomonas sp. SESOKO2 TaxID=2828743 RepID=UPI0021482F3C|nr:class I SAM-dependent methyltransferase [Endozoicomonas sp. SESOKO2]
MKCRHCNSDLVLSLVDLGSSPPSNAYLTNVSIEGPEKWFPLRVLVCEKCWLVQTEDFTDAEDLFDTEYAYFSSFSDSWLVHSKQYVHDMIDRFRLNSDSHVVEVAANDGYLLQYVKEAGIPCTGIEPTASTADAARKRGIPVIEEFFGIRLANELVQKGIQADLTVANNVLAHVPDINDFITGFTSLLKPKGVATFEFPHFLKLVNYNQFDTIYHEHFSYLTLTTVRKIFTRSGLTIFDVEELSTHGGSLRVFVQRSDTGVESISDNVNSLLTIENEHGINNKKFYQDFQKTTDRVKHEFLSFLIKAKSENKSVAAYGAAAKGNTLLNYAGVRKDLLPFVVDRNPNKQRKYMPGSRIPIVEEDVLNHVKPDYIIILPWNLRSEIMHQLSYVHNWGCQFVTAIPRLTIY